MLKLASQLAQSDGASQIEDRHVRDGWEQVAALQRKYLLSKLTSHHTVLYDVISERGPINAAQVRQEYGQRCRGSGLVPVAGRTLSKYVAQLIRSGLVQQERTTTWPNTRLLKPDARFLPTSGRAP